MPLPSPKGKESRKDFVSKCVGELTRKGEGDSAAQRVAICNSRFRKAKAADHPNTDKKKKKKKKPAPANRKDY